MITVVALGTKTTNNGRGADGSQWDWDWSRSSPVAPTSLPRQSTYEAEHHLGQGSNEHGRRRRCKLVWIQGTLLDVDVTSQEVIRWWCVSKFEQMKNVVKLCSLY